MEKLKMLRNELVGKEVTFGEIESEVKDLFRISEKDSFFSDNMYNAFENMSHSYEIEDDKWLNIVFEADTEDDFDIYEDNVKVIKIELI